MELGNLIFNEHNKNQFYDCPDWIIALLSHLHDKLCVVMWNKNQKEYDSPFYNTSNNFIGKNFEVHAYNWNEDVDIPYNFKCGDIEISWYKRLGRDTTINGEYSPEQIIEMFNICLNEIREMNLDD